MKRAATVLLSLSALASVLSAQSAGQIEFFEKKIRPVFVENCGGCHNGKVLTAGLDLSTSAGIRKAVEYGGEAGVIVSKSNPEQSLLLQAISYENRIKMPPTGKLKPEPLEDLAAWVQDGAPLPAAAPGETTEIGPSKTTQAAPAGGSNASRRVFTDAEKNYWAFQKISDPALPAVKNKAWVKSPIDRFILAKLEEKGLKPSPAADKLTLLRRVTFDLTGMPPTEQEIAAFQADKSASAFEKVVDRLLASPRYGEQWGRHWLDVARYADSTGNDEDHRYPYAYHYRDYVIESFNQDVPYDQFLREQLAGDLIPAEKPGAINRRGTVATGFLALGQKALAQQDKKKMLYDMYDEQIDVLSKGILGVTLSCTRCHDHKFDPFLTRDYYSLVSILAGAKNFKNSEPHVSELLFKPLAPKEEFDKYQKDKETLDNKQGDIGDVLEQEGSNFVAQLAPHLAEYMIAARRVYQDKADLAAVSREKGLREDVLKKWVSYLTPGLEPRQQLEAWDKAEGAALETVAADYQERFVKRLSVLNTRLEQTRRVRRRRNNMPPPMFGRDSDPFFYDVYFQGPLSLSSEEREKILSPEAIAKLESLRKELKAIEAAMPPEPEMACAVEEGQETGPVVTGKVLIRGDYNSFGEDAPKGFPVILAGYDQPALTNGSGRMELAKWLTSPEHPLTSRVFTNRVWYWHFGEGLVRTPDNFGRMGERPTHPGLLDYLSRRFVAGGWSPKALHRMILLSNTYQMSSQTADAAYQADPENRLFSRFPRRRLSVEEMRDGMLALDGTIDLKMGGTIQSGFGTDRENSSDRLSVRPEVVKRRMVYLPLRRANLPTLLNLFDFGDATTSASKRTSTTIAPQALFMMNSDFVTDRARNLARMVVDDKSLDQAARVRRLYLHILNRPGSPQEVDSGVTYLHSFQDKPFPDPRGEADAWTSLARILLSSNEYLFLD